MKNKKDINKPKRTLIHGAFSTSNYGDYLFYKIFSNEIKKYNEVDIAKPGSFIRAEIGVKKKYRVFQILKTDNVVFASGGYFGEPNTTKLRLLYWRIKFLYKHILTGLICVVFKKPYSIIGVGVGPINFFLGRLLVRKIFNKAKAVTVRDIESFEYLKKIKVKNPNISVVSDFVISQKDDLIQMACRKEDYRLDKNKKILLYHVTGGSLYADNTITAIKLFIHRNPEYELVLCTDVSNSIQSDYIRNIENAFENNIKFIEYSPNELTYFISKSNLVISHKLHVCIVASVLNRSVVSVPSHKKVFRFFSQINELDRCIASENINTSYILERLEKYKDMQIAISDEIQKKSSINREVLKKFIENHR